MTFFDLRVFNPLTIRCCEKNLEKRYEINEKEKKKNYNERPQRWSMEGSLLLLLMPLEVLKENRMFLRETIKENR